MYGRGRKGPGPGPVRRLSLNLPTQWKFQRNKRPPPAVHPRPRGVSACDLMFLRKIPQKAQQHSHSLHASHPHSPSGCDSDAGAPLPPLPAHSCVSRQTSILFTQPALLPAGTTSLNHNLSESENHRKTTKKTSLHSNSAD